MYIPVCSISGVFQHTKTTYVAPVSMVTTICGRPEHMSSLFKPTHLNIYWYNWGS